MSTTRTTLSSLDIVFVCKYFKTREDFLTLIQTSKKYQNILETFDYNPIPCATIFPYLTKQYLYSWKNRKIPSVNCYIVLYKVMYQHYLQMNDHKTIFNHVIFTAEDLGQNIASSTASFEIPDNVTSIRRNTFQQYEHLSTIILPTSLTKIGSYCFDQCYSLTSIDFPSSIIDIGEYCFRECISLKTILLPSHLKSLKEGCFSGCQNITSVQIPNGLKSIGKDCFSGCLKLIDLNIPTSISALSYGCFNKCTQLKQSLRIPFYCFYDRFY